MSGTGKQLPIREETFELLSRFKGSDETWDDVIRDLIEARQKQNAQEMFERTDDDEFVSLDEI